MKRKITRIILFAWIGLVSSLYATGLFIIHLIPSFIAALRYSFARFLTIPPQNVREILDVYDGNGLKSNINYLNKNDTRREVALMTIQEQSAFADFYIFNAVKNGYDDDFIEAIEEMMSEKRQKRLDMVSVTDIGNLAFCIINSKNINLRGRAQSLYDDFLPQLMLEHTETNYSHVEIF